MHALHAIMRCFTYSAAFPSRTFQLGHSTFIHMIHYNRILHNRLGNNCELEAKLQVQQHLPSYSNDWKVRETEKGL